MSVQHLIAPVPGLTELSRDAAAAADHVIVFARSAARSPEPAVVVELRDAHGNLLARSVVEGDASREAVSERMLDAVELERCSSFVTDPLARRRIIASVCPKAGAMPRPFERVAGRGRISA